FSIWVAKRSCSARVRSRDLISRAIARRRRISAHAACRWAGVPGVNRSSSRCCCVTCWLCSAICRSFASVSSFFSSYNMYAILSCTEEVNPLMVFLRENQVRETLFSPVASPGTGWGLLFEVCFPRGALRFEHAVCLTALNGGRVQQRDAPFGLGDGGFKLTAR